MGDGHRGTEVPAGMVLRRAQKDGGGHVRPPNRATWNVKAERRQAASLRMPMSQWRIWAHSTAIPGLCPGCEMQSKLAS